MANQSTIIDTSLSYRTLSSPPKNPNLWETYLDSTTNRPLIWNGSIWLVIPLIIPGFYTLTSGNGTFSPPVGASYLRVRMVGAGGGGSGNSSNGSAGSGTTFGTSFLIANPGAGGIATGNFAAGGTGGSIGAGATGFRIPGGAGNGGTQTNAFNGYVGGAGGNSFFGGGGAAVSTGNGQAGSP